MGSSPDLNDGGSREIALRPCPTATAADLFDPSVPFVWVVGHSPHRVIEWWDLDLPVVRGEPARRLRVRGVWCELLLETAEFAEVAAQFDGLSAFQMAKPVPDTLSIDRLADDRVYPVLRSNGLSAHFYQPHSMEVATYRTWDPSWMDRLIARESVARLIL